MKKGAIFDMDGLLFDTERVYNSEWYKIAEKYSLSIQQKMLDELRGTNGDLMNSIVNKYWTDVDAAKLTNELFKNTKKTLKSSVPIKKGAIELLKYLKENEVKLAIASSAPITLIYDNLKIAHIETYFDVIVSGEQVVNGKPAPDIFLLAAKKLNLAANECYVLEDGINGVRAGISAGCRTIMVPDLVLPTKDLYENCFAIYTDLFQVRKAIQNNQC